LIDIVPGEKYVEGKRFAVYKHAYLYLPCIPFSWVSDN